MILNMFLGAITNGSLKGKQHNRKGAPHALLNLVDEIHPAIILWLAPNMGLFHTVSSTQEHVNISFLSTAAFMGDGSAYRACLEQSLAEVLHL